MGYEPLRKLDSASDPRYRDYCRNRDDPRSLSFTPGGNARVRRPDVDAVRRRDRCFRECPHRGRQRRPRLARDANIGKCALHNGRARPRAGAVGEKKLPLILTERAWLTEETSRKGYSTQYAGTRPILSRGSSVSWSIIGRALWRTPTEPAVQWAACLLEPMTLS